MSFYSLKGTKPVLLFVHDPFSENRGSNWPPIIWRWTQLSSHHSPALWKILVIYSCFKTWINKSPWIQIYLFTHKLSISFRVRRFSVELVKWNLCCKLYSWNRSSAWDISGDNIWLIFVFMWRKSKAWQKLQFLFSKKTKKSSSFKTITSWNVQKKNRKLFLSLCFKHTYSSAML